MVNNPFMNWQLQRSETKQNKTKQKKTPAKLNVKTTLYI